MDSKSSTVYSNELPPVDASTASTPYFAGKAVKTLCLRSRSFTVVASSS